MSYHGHPEFIGYIDGLRVLVNKDGGGTLGKAYEGTWTVSVQNGPVWLLDNDTIETGTPKTHYDVVGIAAAFAEEEI